MDCTNCDGHICGCIPPLPEGAIDVTALDELSIDRIEPPRPSWLNADVTGIGVLAPRNPPASALPAPRPSAGSRIKRFLSDQILGVIATAILRRPVKFD